MATRKRASKTSTRARLNVDLDDISVSKRTRKKATKELKKIDAKTWIIAILVLVIGVGIGVGAWFLTSKNDCFEIIGTSELTLTLEETYTDEGVKIVSFNKDISGEVVIETDLKKDGNGKYYAEEIGTYYIKYSSMDLKYGKIFKVEKIRLITFVEPSEGMDSAENGGV